ncbi:hypothetical protein [Sandarakinorhabdus sp.]|uniref:phage fiber-tail adaptor protein n=1 Tax=Sandarakinorhabdus sp. TaxID=1916663 RepID=UPI0033422F48
MTLFLKDPGARVDHAVNWDAGYLAGRTILQSAWTVLPAGALELTGAQAAAGRTAIMLVGGTAGQICRVTNRVTLSDGSSDERSLTVRVEER